MMRNKYGNKKITFMGETFDSKREYERYRELRLMERAGAIHDLMRQVKFLLVPNQYVDGKCVERAVNYIADFVYWEGDKMIVEDAKGVQTPEYIIKRKLMLERHQVRIREV